MRLLEVAFKATNKKMDMLVEEVKKISRLKVKVVELKAELKDQVILHVNRCTMDLNMVVVKILKWSIRIESQLDGNGRQLYIIPSQKDYNVFQFSTCTLV